MGHTLGVAREPLPTERTLLQGIAVGRWGTWVWLTAMVVWQRDDLDHPVIATAAVLVALGWTIAATVLLRVRPSMLLELRWVVGELALGWLLLVVDGIVFVEGHTNGGGQNMAATWPLVAIVSAATALAPHLAAAGAVGVATGRLFGALANGESTPDADRWISFAATAAFYAVAALVWSLVSRKLHVVETEVLSRRARDDVARTLHDGVLQTLALVERRVALTDPELAAVARTSDRELRAWLYGAGSIERQGFDARLRRTADRIARSFDVPVTVNVVGDIEPPTVLADALVGALGEAINNAAKHARAGSIVAYVELDDSGSTFASVRDDGIGFDVNRARARNRGIVRSIDERLAAIGGRAEVASELGKGTEVRIWTP